MHRFTQYPSESPFFRSAAALLPVCLLVFIAGCMDRGRVGALAPNDAGCDPTGRLSVETYGSISTKIDWNADNMQCEGMRRPQEAGARLRFAGNAVNGDDRWQLAFILGIPDLRQGQQGHELPTRVTLIAENAGRFFGTQDSEVCWSNISHQKPGDTAAGHYVVSGLLYCVAPVAELNGAGSITLSEMTFSGRLNWSEEKQ